METALIDGDPIVYICGFAAEESTYASEDGTVHATKGQAEVYSRAKGLRTNGITRMVEAEPKSHALYLVKNLLLRAKDNTGATDYRVFLSGTSNFRDKIATIRPYKGTRSNIKPYHYQNIRDYLIDSWDAEVVEDIEADDALGINQTNDSVICTIDKDLDNIPGYHYNYQTNKLYEVSERRATYNFYRQLLMGDTVDNIQGVPGIGKKRSAEMLDECVDEESMYWTCLCEYVKKYDKPMEALIENGRLLWILRERGEIWEPKW